MHVAFGCETTKTCTTMKTIIVVLLCCSSLLFLNATLTPLPLETDLITALNKQWVTVNAISTGGNSEECVNLEVKNISAQPLRISLAPGTLFNTLDNDNQDILVTRPSEFVVNKGTPVIAKAYGFCCQADKGLSNPGDELTLTACTDEKLLSLAKHLSTTAYDPALQQHAVWAVSDKHSVGGILNDNRTQCNSLRTFTAGLLGQPVPTYDVDYGYELNTPFIYAPKTLKGTMNYRIAQTGKASLHLYDPNGKLFQTFFEDRTMSSGFYTQRFSYTATDMEAGEYQVKLILEGRVLSVSSIVM